MNSVEKKVIGVTVFGHALCHFNMLILAGALLTIVKDLESTTSQITAIGTISYFIFGLGAFPSGMLVSHTHPKMVLKGFFLFTAAASLFTGLSKNIEMFTLGLAMMGLFGSLYHVSGVTLISQTVRSRGKALGIHGVAGSAGITLAPVIAGAILTFYGWRVIYLTASVLGLIGFLILFFDHEIPVRHTVLPAGESKPFDRKMIAAFALMIGVMMINGLVYRGFLTMLPTYVSENLSPGSPFAGGLFSTLILSVGMIGQYTGGHFSDRFSMVRLYLITLLLSLPFLFLLGFVQNMWIVGAGLFFALFHFPQQPIENHLISRWMPHKWTGSGFGIKFAATFGVGAFAAGLTGIIAERASISLVFPILAGLVFLSAALVFILILYLKMHHMDVDQNR
ncbi:MFS transporter [bacterium]|nr:MFS transporter [bacterium]